MNKDNILVGKTVAALFLAEDRTALKFLLSDGQDVIVRCDADCCSHTWVEDVLNIEALIGAEVVRVEDIALPAEFCVPTKTKNYEEEMTYYGCAIETTRGRCTLAFRNSSNGYYGGSLSWPGDSYYGGVYDQNVSSNEWTPLTGTE